MLGLQIIMSCPHITLNTGMTRCKNIFPRLVVACLRTQILISRRNTYCVPHHTAIFKNTSLFFNRLLVFHLTLGGWRPQEGSLFVVHLNQSTIQDLISVQLPQTMGNTCVCEHTARQFMSTIIAALHLLSEKTAIGIVFM